MHMLVKMLKLKSIFVPELRLNSDIVLQIVEMDNIRVTQVNSRGHLHGLADFYSPSKYEQD